MKKCTHCHGNYDEDTYTKSCPYCSTSNKKQSEIRRTQEAIVKQERSE
jgi:hypothetical protein